MSSFDIVAASYQHREKERGPIWRSISAGATFGSIVVFLGMVGITTMFAQRWIIVDVLNLAHTVIIACAVAAGMLVAHKTQEKRLQRLLLLGFGAGATMGAITAVLALCIHSFKLHKIFIALKKNLLDILVFEQSIGTGVALLVFGGAVLAMIGALLYRCPVRVRRPIVLGLAWAFFIGLFQELLQLMLQRDYLASYRELVFNWDGLLLRGAIGAFVIAAIITVLWDDQKVAVRQRIERMDAGQRRVLLGLKILCGVVVIIGFPWFAGNFIGQVLMLVGLYVLMGMGLNLELGLAGLLDLGFVAFFAVGAYSTALLTSEAPIAIAQLSYWQALPIAVLLSVMVGVLFGVPVLKVRGDYLAVATLGLGEIVRVLVVSDFAAPVLGGAQGILGIPRPLIGEFELDDPVDLFYLTLACAALAGYCAWRLENSRLGRAWTAIRDDEDVAQALGINLINVKLMAYGLGAGFAGVAGSIFAVMLSSIFPHSFQLLISINVLALIIVGGMGSLPGVVVGAAALIGLPELLREFGEYRFLFYGLVIVIMMRIKPEGLWPSASRRREMLVGEEDRAVVEQELAARKSSPATQGG